MGESCLVREYRLTQKFIYNKKFRPIDFNL